MSKEINKKKYYLHSGKYNKTTLFALPMIGVQSRVLAGNGFVNAFYDDAEYGKRDSIPSSLFLLFDVTNVTASRFEIFCKYMRALDNYVDEYDPEEGKVMIVMSVPDKYLGDLQHFKKGKYSWMSDEYIRAKFQRRVNTGMDMYGNIMWKPSKNWMIVKAHKTIREQIENDLDVTLPEDAEVYSKPYPEHEIYRFNKPT